jgi:hypothetical protein
MCRAGWPPSSPPLYKYANRHPGLDAAGVPCTAGQPATGRHGTLSVQTSASDLLEPISWIVRRTARPHDWTIRGVGWQHPSASGSSLPKKQNVPLPRRNRVVFEPLLLSVGANQIRIALISRSSHRIHWISWREREDGALRRPLEGVRTVSGSEEIENANGRESGTPGHWPERRLS